MSRNDTFLIDGIVDSLQESRLDLSNRGAAFEYFVCQQVLKNLDLEDHAIKSGIIDGRRDGGIDAFYVFVNGHLLTSELLGSMPKSHVCFDVYIISCKHRDTFQQSPLEKLSLSIRDVLDFSRSEEDIPPLYSEDLIALRRRFASAYRKVAAEIDTIRFHIFYASRGDTHNIDTGLRAHSERIEQDIRELFSDSKPAFQFLGSAELMLILRKNKQQTLALSYKECLQYRGQYLAIVNIIDYFKFITDDNGELKKFLFESNVRTYMGLNRVNSDIINSLINDKPTDFWWLNNGITMLSSKPHIIESKILITNVQIVNGLQTSESIYRHISRGVDSDDRCVLIKIISSEDEIVRNKIIKSTNNQTSIGYMSLKATDRIQQNIEEILLKSGWFYERRENKYAGQGFDRNKIVSPTYLASGVVALVFKSPHKASTFKSKALRIPLNYSRIFDDSFPPLLWLRVVELLKATDYFLTRNKPAGPIASEGFLRRWRYIVAILVLARQFRTFGFTSQMIAEFTFDKDEIAAVWNFIMASQGYFIAADAKPGRRSFNQLMQAFATDEGIVGFESIGRNIGIRSESKKGSLQTVSHDVIDSVDRLLPSQPWKIGIHSEIADKLCLHVDTVREAIKALIASGRRYKQKDGIVFSINGKVIGFDETRVEEEMLKDFDITDLDDEVF